jgi:hypothetical protein
MSIGSDSESTESGDCEEKQLVAIRDVDEEESLGNFAARRTERMCVWFERRKQRTGLMRRQRLKCVKVEVPAKAILN